MSRLVIENVATRSKASDLKHLKILVVDDSKDLLAMMTVVLEMQGANVVTAGSSEEAFQLLETFTFDLLISDICLPEEDGYSLIRRVRQLDDPRRCRIPAIAVTAMCTSEDRELSLKCGFHQYIAKPFSCAKLIKRVIELTAQHR